MEQVRICVFDEGAVDVIDPLLSFIRPLLALNGDVAGKPGVFEDRGDLRMASGGERKSPFPFGGREGGEALDTGQLGHSAWVVR